MSQITLVGGVCNPDACGQLWTTLQRHSIVTNHAVGGVFLLGCFSRCLRIALTTLQRHSIVTNHAVGGVCNPDACGQLWTTLQRHSIVTNHAVGGVFLLGCFSRCLRTALDYFAEAFNCHKSRCGRGVFAGVFLPMLADSIMHLFASCRCHPYGVRCERLSTFYRDVTPTGLKSKSGVETPRTSGNEI